MARPLVQAESGRSASQPPSQSICQNMFWKQLMQHSWSMKRCERIAGTTRMRRARHTGLNIDTGLSSSQEISKGRGFLQVAQSQAPGSLCSNRRRPKELVHVHFSLPEQLGWQRSMPLPSPLARRIHSTLYVSSAPDSESDDMPGEDLALDDGRGKILARSQQ